MMISMPDNTAFWRLCAASFTRAEHTAFRATVRDHWMRVMADSDFEAIWRSGITEFDEVRFCSYASAYEGVCYDR